MVYISNKNHALIFNSERLSNSWEGCMWGKLNYTFEPNILILNSSFRQWKDKVSGRNIKKKKNWKEYWNSFIVENESIMKTNDPGSC